MRANELTTATEALWDVQYFSTSDQEDNDSDDSSSEDEKKDEAK